MTEQKFYLSTLTNCDSHRDAVRRAKTTKGMHVVSGNELMQVVTEPVQPGQHPITRKDTDEWYICL